jgi:hypothetical protein
MGVLRLGEGGRAAAGAEDHADAPPLFQRQRRRAVAGEECLAPRRQREPGDRPVCRRACASCTDAGSKSTASAAIRQSSAPGLEAGDAPDGGAAGEQPFRKRGAAGAEGRDRAPRRDGDIAAGKFMRGHAVGSC